MEVIFGLIGVALVGRAVYVAQKIKKEPETKKFGDNPKTGIAVMSVLGAVLFLIGCIGLPILNASKPSAGTADRQKNQKMTLENFIKNFNKNAEKFDSLQITNYTVQEGSEADIVGLKINDISYINLALTTTEPYLVNGIILMVGSSDDAAMLSQAMNVLYSVVATFDPAYTNQDIINFASKIFEEETVAQISKNKIRYVYREINGAAIISVDDERGIETGKGN